MHLLLLAYSSFNYIRAKLAIHTPILKLECKKRRRLTFTRSQKLKTIPGRDFYKWQYAFCKIAAIIRQITTLTNKQFNKSTSTRNVIYCSETAKLSRVTCSLFTMFHGEDTRRNSSWMAHSISFLQKQLFLSYNTRTSLHNVPR